MAFSVSKQTAIWLAIFAVVGAVLLGIQMIRVNQPKSVAPVAEVRTFTSAGPLTPGQVEIAANSFYSQKMDLNRRMKLNGSFKTASLKSLVVVAVIRDADLENWKAGAEVAVVVKTNPVPGGKITPVLEPGVYHLVIDNRNSDQVKVVSTEFVME
jgi:pheromone shutdown protein TraB